MAIADRSCRKQSGIVKQQNGHVGVQECNEYCSMDLGGLHEITSRRRQKREISTGGKDEATRSATK